MPSKTSQKEPTSSQVWMRLVQEISLLPEENLNGKAEALDLPNGLELVDRLSRLDPAWAMIKLEELVPEASLDRTAAKGRNQLALAMVQVLSQADELNQVSRRRKTPVSPSTPKAQRPNQSQTSSFNISRPNSAAAKTIPGE